jgi:hypothetical protein
MLTLELKRKLSEYPYDLIRSAIGKLAQLFPATRV